MQVLIPLAMSDSLFNKEEYFFSKPLIEINGHPMIECVINNLKSFIQISKFIVVITQDDAKYFSLDKIIRLAAAPIKVDIIITEGQTNGALCSCLLAIDHIDFDKPLVISNGDQIIDINSQSLASMYLRASYDAGVIIFDSVHPRWSYVELDINGEPMRFAEKDVTCRNAIAGFYYFSRSENFINAAFNTIRYDQQVNDKYFIAPSLNQLILEGKKIAVHRIESKQYHSFYSPQKLKEYENHVLLNRQRDAVPVKKEINVVIPAAGLGSRFSKAGYAHPKPFVDVKGLPMIERVLDNLSLNAASNVYVILQSEHRKAYAKGVARLIAKGASIIEIDGVTEGTACTVLSAIDVINTDSPLLIANSDQVVDVNLNNFIQDAFQRSLDGSILTFEEPGRDPKWSYARCDADDMVLEVKEKEAISSLATVGIYYFAKGREFIEASVKMIAANDRVNGEFYTCPVYNYLIKMDKKVGYYSIEKYQMKGLGTPEDLNSYLVACEV